MKRIAVLGAIVVSGLTAVGVTAQGLPGIEGIEHVAGKVYKIAGAGGNTVVFERANDVVLIDTKLPNSGEAIMTEVRKITDKPLAMIINTHSHPDHMGSNNELSGDGIEVIAHVNSEKRMEAEGGPFGASNVDRSFSSHMKIGEGADEIDLYYFGAGHTDGDAFVAFPAARTVMAGDIYAWHMSPLIDPGSGGSMLALPTSVTAAYYTIPNVDYWIQGHGGVSTSSEFLSFVTFNRALVQIAEQTVQSGGTEREALDRLAANPSFAIFLGTETLPGLEYGGSPKSRALINLMVAFQELRGEEPQLIMGLPREEWPE
ncbi:hypothetical protein GCM10009127_13800 [Alteraurantiacibacter aestuarii]|uniref:MBL fold metallo-hydrolase n=1 Tax=Alteraurantiacibacter aestuarii TaxID=650004 RepID=A0A844ZLV5_9SPHN|nr:MBL fold metallo-hydrolase [Alteraurantiacibacter aestuarii]MXO88030.1 MBL fold metallo-hydrolase [Alteraurantiacibacter aestuarii]